MKLAFLARTSIPCNCSAGLEDAWQRGPSGAQPASGSCLQGRELGAVGPDLVIYPLPHPYLMYSTHLAYI